MRYSETLKKAVLDDYNNSDLTVLQIAEKHHIRPRIIYHWTQTGRATRRRLDYDRLSFRFTKKEVDVLQAALSNYNGDPIAESLKDRLTLRTV